MIHKTPHWLLLGILTLSLLLTAGTSSAKSPYTLEQIEEHLRTIYQFDMEQKKGLRRWQVPVLKYYIGTYKKALNNEEKDFFRQKFKDYAAITGLKVRETVPNEPRNVLLVFTPDFYSTISIPYIRKLLFGNRSDAVFESAIAAFKKNNLTSYGVQYSIQSDHINREYVLIEIDAKDRKNLQAWSTFIVFDTFAIREGGKKSNIIQPSLFNVKPDYRHKQAWQLQAIDRYFLEALYSEQVRYGMPIEAAISIMAPYIHQRLGG